MKIKLIRSFDTETKAVRLIYSTSDEQDTTDSSWYVNRLEGTSPNQSCSFMIEDET